MNNKVIFVVLDGLNYTVAQHCLGYLNGLVEIQQATLYPVVSELPSLSRPLYECLLTGVKPIESGIVHNQINRLSNQESIFSLAHAQGKITAAAAYHWVSELYNRSPYHPVEDRDTSDPEKNIQYGRFYHWDHYPDEALFLDAESLRRQHNPDLLLIHPMNIDDAGHRYGLDSKEYRNTARHVDVILSDFIPRWIKEGYQIVVTSDHGMNTDFSHGGTLAEEREVPLFVIGDRFSHQTDILQNNLTLPHLPQTKICGLLCELLGLTHHKPFVKEMLR